MSTGQPHHPPTLAEALAMLVAHRRELEAAGVARAGVFGSTARGAAGMGSDIDVLLEFAAGREPDLFTYAGLRRRVAEIVPGADVIAADALRPEMAETVRQDVVHAF
ncbi:MAG TPA: nucleotidyltransferase domain-containing protein [Azospirillaceae bacterium]|nr:nucleotidyltransferase domain-containing protein [Azospirillaceae bacterium]